MAKFPDAYIRSSLVLSRKQVEQIDEELRSRWSLFCPGSSDPRAQVFFSKIDPEAVRVLETLSLKRSLGEMSDEEDTLFYDRMAQPPFGIWVCQSRRSFILDTIVAADTYIKIYKPREVLEIGTGLGFGAGVLARRHPDVNFTGIDRSGESIKFAQGKSSKLKNLRYLKADIADLANNGSYDLAVSLAGIPSGSGRVSDLVESTANLLKPDGILLGYTTTGLSDKRYGTSKLGLIYKTVIGGFEAYTDRGDSSWQSAPFEVFKVGSLDTLAYINYNHNTVDWPRFADYINANRNNHDEQTFTYFRTSKC
jgi:SAM-dependent methyltransferase